jgi:hypothetical protein
MKKLIKLSKFLKNKSFVKEAAILDIIIKEAGIKDETFDILKDKFPKENDGKLMSISNNMYKKLYEENSEDILQAASERIRSSETLEEIINYLKKEKNVLSDIKEDEDVMKKIKEEEIPKADIPWVLKILNNEEKDPLSEIIDTAKYVYNKKSQGELSDDFSLQDYNTLSELRDFIDEKFAGNKDLYIARAKTHSTSDEGIVKLYESDNFLVIHPKTIKSSIYWSKGTNWCTSRLEGNMFSSYNNKDGMLVYVITKNKDLLKKSPDSKNNLSKISVGFVLNEDNTDAEIEDKGTMTVELNNRSITKEDVEKHLGSEFGNIVNASKKFLIDNKGAWIEKAYEDSSLKIIENKRNNLDLESGLEDFISNNNVKSLKELIINPSFFVNMIKKERETVADEEKIISFEIMRNLLKQPWEDSNIDYYDIAGIINNIREDKNMTQSFIDIIFEEKIYERFDRSELNEFVELLEFLPISIGEANEKRFILYICRDDYSIDEIAKSLKYHPSIEYTDYEIFEIAFRSKNFEDTDVILEVSEGVPDASRSAERFIDDYISEEIMKNDQEIKNILDKTKKYRNENNISIQDFIDSFYEFKKTFKKLDEFLEKQYDEEITYEENSGEESYDEEVIYEEDSEG